MSIIQCPELSQIHVHQGDDAIQQSHLLSSPSPPAFNLAKNFSAVHPVFFRSDPAFTTVECVLLKIKVVGASHNSNHRRHLPSARTSFLSPLQKARKPLGTPICILKGVQLHGILRVTSPTKTTSDKTCTFVVYSNQLKDPYACSNT